MLRNHIIRRQNRAICESLTCVTGREKACMWLGRDDDGWFYCHVFGFRNTQFGLHGVCVRKKMRVCYDRHMLEKKMIMRWNFCFYRVAAPLIFVLSCMSLKYLINFGLGLWKKN